MKKYALNIDDRKVLVSRLMELTGLHSRYTFMPRCAYIVGSYTVEKEGTLVIEDNAAPEIIRTLLDEGIIREEGAETPETPETEAACGETTESECEESDETVDSTEDTQPTEEPDATAEESPEIQEPVDEDEPMDTVNDTDADEAPAPIEQPTLQDVDELTISLPMSGHTAQSLRNFLNLMYSRGPLLNKAMGTNFTVSQGLLDALEQATPHTVSEMLDELEEYRIGGTMTHAEVKAMVEEMGLPYAYDHFAEGESPDPPFICFLYPRAKNFGADNLVYHHFNRLAIEVYTDYKDPDTEAAIEEVLTEHELFYEKSEVWIETEKMYEVLYELTV